MSIYGSLLESVANTNYIDSDSIVNEISNNYKVYEQDYDIEITTEQINELCNKFKSINESCNIDVITEASINFDNIYKKIGIKDNKLSQEIKKLSKNITSIIKKDGINKLSIQSITSSINDFYEKIGDIIEGVALNLPSAKIKGYDTANINKAVALVLFQFITLNIIHEVALVLFGSTGVIISSLIIDVFIDEIAKQAAIKKKFTVEYTLVLNLFNIGAITAKADNKLRQKIKGFGMSFTAVNIASTIIQWITNNENVQKKLGINTKEDKDNIEILGNEIGIIIRLLWNYNLISKLHKYIIKSVMN